VFDGFMDQWHERKRPVCLERRFEFESYSATRDFLDRLGDFSEAKQRFPDILPLEFLFKLLWRTLHLQGQRTIQQEGIVFI
jgi:pterin-4a-carbinolamine dehydratase